MMQGQFFTRLTRSSPKLKIALLVLLMLVAVQSIAAANYISFLASIFGQEPEEFIDATKDQTEVVKLDGGYLILYEKQMQKTEKENGLYLKNTITQEVIKVAEDTCTLDYGAIIPGKGMVALVYTPQPILDDNYWGQVYLQVIDYNKKLSVGKPVGVLLYKLDRNHLESHRIAQLLVFKDEASLGLRIEKYNSETNKTLETLHFCYRINQSGLSLIEGLDYVESAKQLPPSGFQTGGKYLTTQNETLKVFRIGTDNDNPWANYKPMYNGVYICNETTKVCTRISKNETGWLEGYAFPTYWLENGSKILRGQYLYDATGKKKESQLLEGNIICLARIE